MADQNFTLISEDPYSTLTSRLTQTIAMIDCLRNTISSTDGVLDLPPMVITEALWGVSTMLGQAKIAWDQIESIETQHV
jgi:hypothetical protein